MKMDKDAISIFEENNFDNLLEKYIEEYLDKITSSAHWLEFVMQEYRDSMGN